jgi:hypothetical protein
MVLRARMATGAAMVGVPVRLGRPLSSSATASCAWREKDEYRRDRSTRTFGLCSGIGAARTSRAECVVVSRSGAVW